MSTQKVLPQNINAISLVYYEFFPNIEEAIGEEKRIKGSSRQMKINLINAQNPEWIDLYEIL